MYRIFHYAFRFSSILTIYYMRRILPFLLFLACFSPYVQAQSGKKELAAGIAAVQKAFDNNSDSLEYLAEKTVPLAIKLKDIEAEMKIQRLRCDKLFVNGQFDKAIKILLEVARHTEQAPVSKEKAQLYFAIAQVNGFNKYPEVAEQYLRTAVKYSVALKDDTLLGNAYNRLGIYYEKYKKDLDSAMFFYKLSLAYNDKAQDFVGKAYSLENIAGIYGERNDLVSALGYQKEALFYKLQKGRKIDAAIAYINIAETFDRLGKTDSVIDYTQRSLTLSTDIKYRDLESYCYAMLGQIYEKRGDLKKALEFSRQYATLKDTIYTETKNKQLAVQNTKYETEKKEQKIKELNQQATIQNLQLRQRNISLLIAIVLIITGSVIFYLVYNRRKLQARARLQEEINKQQFITTREVINAEERERKRIAADLHDGVGQLLSATLLNLNSFFSKMGPQRSTEADRILGLVTESYDELRSISHQMMPNALLKAGLGSAVKELVSGIDSDKLAISLELVGLNERLKEEVETVLYRVIQESINNVIKHAGATKLNIQVIKDEDGVSVTIEDNGKGFDMKKVKSDGIGLKNMYSRVQFQQGTVDIDSQLGKGTLVLIHIPMEAAGA
ncbi:MAG: degS 1 [Flavipsychrobacter sp.]|nr:degS 1 [Flavipsychrobacter sp.]